MNATELNTLTKQEINNALGAKYSDNQLKNITKEALIDEAMQLVKPEKAKVKKEPKRGYAIRGSLAFLREKFETEKEFSLEECAKEYCDLNPSENYERKLNHFKSNIRYFQKNINITINVKDDVKYYSYSKE